MVIMTLIFIALNVFVTLKFLKVITWEKGLFKNAIGYTAGICTLCCNFCE